MLQSLTMIALRCLHTLRVAQIGSHVFYVVSVCVAKSGAALTDPCCYLGVNLEGVESSNAEDASGRCYEP